MMQLIRLGGGLACERNIEGYQYLADMQAHLAAEFTEPILYALRDTNPAHHRNASACREVAGTGCRKIAEAACRKVARKVGLKSRLGKVVLQLRLGKVVLKSRLGKVVPKNSLGKLS